MKDHLRPVGKPAPPRPRRPEAFISLTIQSRPLSMNDLVSSQQPRLLGALKAPVMEAVEIGEDAVLVSEHGLSSLLRPACRRRRFSGRQPLASFLACLIHSSRLARPLKPSSRSSTQASSLADHEAIWSKCQMPILFSSFSSAGPTPQISFRSSALPPCGLLQQFRAGHLRMAGAPAI